MKFTLGIARSLVQSGGMPGFGLARWMAVGAMIGLLALLLVLTPTQADAQQTGPRPYRAIAGPYLIGVFSKASQLSLGTVDYVVTVNEPVTEAPIGDAKVRIKAIAAADGHEGWALALNTPDNPDRYTARVDLKDAGVWKMSVEVDSHRGKVEINTPSHVVQKPRLSASGGFVFVGVFIVLLMGLGYAVWSVRRAQRARDAGVEQ